jgi:uncharacterized protein YkwD
MRIIELAFATLHLFPAPGVINPMALPDVVREVQAAQQSKQFARDELRAVNDLRAKHGLPPVDTNGQTQGEHYVHQAR